MPQCVTRSSISTTALAAWCLAAAMTGPVQARQTAAQVVRHSLINQRLSVSTSELLTLDVPAGNQGPLTVSLPINGGVYTLDLATHSIRSPEYKLLVQVAGGDLVEQSPGPVRTMRGTVREVPGGAVVASLEDDGLHATLILPDGGRFGLEPVAAVLDDAQRQEYVLYRDFDVVSEGTCGLDHGPIDVQSDQPLQGGPAGGGVAGSDCYYTTELAIDSDYPYFTDNASSVANVESKINSIINAVNLQYQSQTEIRHEIVTIVVRTSEEDDPYGGDPIDAGTLLGQFRNHWLSTMGSVQRDVTKLFTGRSLSGSTIGIAWGIGAICTSSAYCLVEDINNAVCRWDLSAHELGHLWGGFHCDCPGFTMNPSITCANQFSDGTVNSIVAHRETRACLFNECIPGNDDCENADLVGEGSFAFTTIMSSTDGFAEQICDFSGDGQVGSDIWYRYTAACNGLLDVDACDADYDAKISIYQSFCPGTVNQAIACDDNSCGAAPMLTISTTAGTDYLIRVGGHLDAQGSGTLNIIQYDCADPPANDDCGSAQLIGEESVAFDTSAATTDGPDEPSVCDAGELTAIEKDIWYRHFSECDAQITVSACDSNFDSRIIIYGAACPGGPGSAIACAAGGTCGKGATVSFAAAAGNIYRIRVGGTDGSAGAGTISLTCGEPADCPTDTNGDLVTDVTDLVTVIVAWGTDDPTADVNGDGVVDVLDLVQVVVGWGPCP